MKQHFLHTQEVTRGFDEDISLRQRYQEEGFGLDTVFEKHEWADGRITELKRTYDLADGDIRLVIHISTPETGEKPIWEVYARASRGVPVLFLQRSSGSKGE